MRKSTRFRLYYFLAAILTYAGGFTFLPDTIKTNFDTWLSGLFLAAYFIILPMAFWFCVIKAGAQKRWKIIIPLSLASVVARYSMPDSLASYFEFLSWLRYPIIAILLVIELAIMFHVISSLWKARKLKGDPRINALINHINANDKKRDMALLVASEPASWYYAIPLLSKNHIPSLAKLSLLSAQRWHCVLLLIGLVSASVITYLLLHPISELLALIVCTFIGYSVISLIANHRISRHYCMYCHNNHFIVNATFYNLLFAPLTQLSSCEVGVWPLDKEQLTLGRGKAANIKLTFAEPVYWFTLMGAFCERQSVIYMCVDNPENLARELNKYTAQQKQNSSVYSQTQ